MSLFPYGRPRQRIHAEKRARIRDFKFGSPQFAAGILRRKKGNAALSLYTRTASIGKILRAFFKEHGYPLKSYGNMGLDKPLYVAVSRI